jgi:hypothetical protein
MIRAGPEYLRISYATVLRMTKAGDLHAIRVAASSATCAPRSTS